ncbi:MHS family MFS transporter [Nocardioides sp. NBC_00850]|uniref:MFS transporter n=1 Tax=Nocardioides sp. NBC_00850 TaxID=2976001 RepID=UPI00386FD12F|nr:MHS family MFS transporter [Nocardioides sp. NBC_00850]
MSHSSTTTADVRRVGLASLMGTTIEYYDFFIYGTAAALVFGEVFFPNSDPLTGSLLSFATFGVAFVARPLGGVVFGHFGDRVGRKVALVTTLLTMGTATVGIGLVPSYDAIGVAAPTLLVVLRFAQGIALGGEYGGAVLMTVEHSPAGKRGFYGSWVQTGAQFGLIVANVVYLIVGSSMGDEAFRSWGWRVPFWISVVLVVLGLAIRLRLEESPEFTALKKSNDIQPAPVIEVLRRHKTEVLLIAGAAVGNSVTFYVAAVFGLSYGAGQGFSRNQMLVVIIAAAIWVIVASIAVGAISDRGGRKAIFIAGNLAIAATIYPWAAAIESGSLGLVMVAYIVMLTGYSMTWGTIGVFFAEAFTGAVRYTGLSVGFTIGVIVGGAVTPLALTKLVDSYSSAIPVVLWVAGATVVSALCGIPLRRADRADKVGPAIDSLAV